jgi:predicted  nucleic acid-binding Zn-ribbon protein
MDAESQLLAELGRQIKDAEAAIQRQDNALIENDAEIERLKEQYVKQEKQFEEWKKLITELADYVSKNGFGYNQVELLDRAREATK